MNIQAHDINPVLARPARTDGMTLAQAIGTFASETRCHELPVEVIEKIKICLFFNLAIALAGHSQVASAVAGASHFPTPRNQGSRIFVSGEWVAAPNAAFANAAMMHARAQDDFQHSANVHVGALTIPAALALGEWRDFDGRSLLAALAVAYQVATVLGEEHTAVTTPRGFRASGLYAAPAAAAACAGMAGVDPAQATHAVSLGAHFAAGLNQAWIAGTNEWRLHLAHASRNAVNCLLLAEAGNDSATDVFEGKYGYYGAHGITDLDVDRMVGKLFGPWRLDTVAFKPLPVCGINQGPARNAMSLARSGEIDFDNIERIEIALPPEDVAYPGIAATGPILSPGAALMRSAYVVATCLKTGELRYDNLLNRTDESVLSLADRTQVVTEDLTPMSHILRLTFKDGTAKNAPYEATGREFILEKNEIRSLFEGIADELALPADRIARIEDIVWRLDRNTDPADILDAMIA